MIENIYLEGHKSRGTYTPAKKIDLGSSYLVYVSGIQAPRQDGSNQVVTDNIEEQTHLVFQHIEQILTNAGASLDHVVKAVIYITDMQEFDQISPIRAQYFKNSMPISTLVEVNRMVLDGARIEVEVTAIVPKES